LRHFKTYGSVRVYRVRVHKTAALDLAPGDAMIDR
jgi:hypothetical protein